MNTASKVAAIARVTILESVRRKDAYVVLVLGLVVMLGAALFSSFGVEGLEKFVKDIALSVTSLFASVICIAAAARQIPHEIENRTLYPLLAKPIGRSVFFLGKFVGVGVISSVVVLAFFVEILVLFMIFKIDIGVLFFQAVYLRVLSMWFIAALTLAMSLVLTHAANVTISMLLVLAMQTFANTIITVHGGLTGVSQRIAEAIYWFAPHLELFNLGKLVVHEYPPVPIWVLAALTVYAIVYSGIFLAAGCVKLRRMAL